ncbi:ElyC/SanA/YdcF family protein [Echinicola sediminis]
MRRKKLVIAFVILILPIALVVFANFTVEKQTSKLTYSDVSKIKKNRVGLVLGTAKELSSGRMNLYFKYRIDATVELYENGKIEFVLVSGDNGNKDYDEPTDIKNELVKRGIPENKIYLDYAGFRTLDSIVRAKEIFGLEDFTIISQQFHNERAIYLANHHNINAVGFNAKNVSLKRGIKTQVREYFARTKAFMDILLGVEPKFLGEEIEIG